MAHFAKLDTDNKVTNVIVIDNEDIKDHTGTEVESIGVSVCHKLFGENTTWKQTSYNHGFRGNFAGLGMTYAENIRTIGVASTDVFLGINTNPSWTIGINTATWYPPSNPGDPPVLSDSDYAAGKRYRWDENNYNSDPSTAWVLITP